MTQSSGSAGAQLQRPKAALFLAIRRLVPEARDFLDVLVINAAKLDIHMLEVEPADRYWYDDSSGDKNLRYQVSQRVGLPFWTANYLIHFSNIHKFLYVATPKVGCTTLKHYLQQVELQGLLDYRYYGEEHDAALSPLLQPVDCVRAFLEALDNDRCFKFTFVRNPFSRALSGYIDKIVNSKPERERLLPPLGIEPDNEPPSFAHFLRAVAHQAPELRDYHWAEQSWLTQPAAIQYDFVGRFERFGDDFEHVCKQIGFTATVPAVEHSTHADKRYSEFYGPEEVELVREIYSRDFQTFGYDDRLP